MARTVIAGRVTPLALASIVAASLLSQACLVGPNYKRPPVGRTRRVPRRRRCGDRGVAGATSAGRRLFEDEALQTLIRTALEHNDDVRMAAARILEAQAQLGITRADQFPTVSAGVDVLGERPSRRARIPVDERRRRRGPGVGGVGARFLGQVPPRDRSGARAAAGRASGDAARCVTTLVSQVASAYFGLRALDLELDISRRTLASRQESLQLTQVREQGGVTSLLDVRQAEQLVYGATGEIATLERQIAQQENFISVLLGGNPGPIARGRALTDQPHQPDVPAGLPSALLERRPDIQRAEQTAGGGQRADRRRARRRTFRRSR